MIKITTMTPYSEIYKEACFEAWYSSGKPVAASVVVDIMPEDEFHRKPDLETIRRWRNESNWDLRADDLDRRVAAEMERRLVAGKVEMLDRQAKNAREIQQKAMEFLDASGFDSSSSAATAFIRAAELERTSMGLSDAILKIARMTNEQLMAETMKMLEKFQESGEPGEIIDVAELPDENADDKE